MTNASAGRAWISHAIGEIEADLSRSADTHLIRLDLPELSGISVYLKDETIHPTGSLKHRLARSLFLYGICNGLITEGTPVVEASSGSTAISEAFFARLLGLPFTAVLPRSTAPAKKRALKFAGAQVQEVDPGVDACVAAAELARQVSGCFLDQFTYAERATDWRGNNNIAESLFNQMAREAHPAPAWVVVGAGTGGTSATIGRYIRYRSGLAPHTRLCVVDPESSAFFPAFSSGQKDAVGRTSPVVEGIGRHRVEASFVASVVDRMIQVPDAASVAAVLWLAKRTGRRFGPSTGTNIVGVLQLARELAKQGQRGSIVTLGCDAGDRYAETVYDAGWNDRQGLDLTPWSDAFGDFERTGVFKPVLPSATR